MNASTPGGRDPQRDRALCRTLLPHVSRTFALSIEALPDRLRDAVRVSYLLCRIVDTIEDAPGLHLAGRARLFDAFDAALAEDGAPPEPLERGFAELIVGAAEVSEAEQRLGAGAGAALRVFRALPAAQRAAIRPRVLEMSAGMREYAARRGGASWPIEDLQDLERYCYFVAGTVGLLLTALFLLHGPVADPRRRRAIESRAVSFGVGLQLVNIVKDVAADGQRGVCYLPRELAERRGLSRAALLDPAQRSAGVAVIGELVALAREHLGRARRYTELWPPESAPEVRLFCAVPLALALATLREVERGPDTLRPGRTPRVSHEAVARILRDARGAALSDAALGQLLAS